MTMSNSHVLSGGMASVGVMVSLTGVIGAVSSIPFVRLGGGRLRIGLMLGNGTGSVSGAGDSSTTH